MLIYVLCRFLFYVDAGTNGRVSDTGIWNKCSLNEQLHRNNLHIPHPAPLPHVENNFPYVIIGDEGFPLLEQLLIPYPGAQCHERIDRRIFNYRYVKCLPL